MKKYFPFLLSMLVWLFCFREFLANQLPLTSDAQAYYEHIQFFIENITKGIYPLWDPHHQVPTEFFLRRFGSFNPFYTLIVILNSVGVPYDTAYRLFLVFYYFLGMTGFYLLAKRIWANKTVAFTAYLLLTFSALGTRMFDSYILFMFIAMVWFFYFLVAFTQKPDRKSLLGLIFSLMILATTYIPFYFLVIAATFVLTFAVVYVTEMKNILRRYWEFIVRNKAFTALCILILLLTMLVPLFFYQEAGRGEFVLPMRNAGHGQSHVLSVSMEAITWWGIVEDLLFSSYFLFSNLSNFQSAVFYIPLFAYVLFLAGVITTMNKKLVLLALWGLGLLLMNMPLATPVYAFLYEHVFIFKYFRNLHFFLWVILLPIFILFVTGQFGQFWSLEPKTRKQKTGLMIFLVLVHAGLAVFLFCSGSRNWSSYLVLVLSFVLFGARFFTKAQIRNAIGLLPILCIVIVEPLEVYSYFVRNYLEPHRLASTAQKKEEPSKQQPPAPAVLDHGSPLAAAKPSAAVMYYGVGWFNLLIENIDPAAWEQYRHEKFLVYDRVELIDDRTIDFEKIGASFKEKRNVAFVARDGKDYQSPSGGQPAPRREPSAGLSPELGLITLNPNEVRLRTNFPVPRFLVYNDSFHSGWKAYVNEKPADIWRANVAFKGLWIPAGEQTVYFRFGAPAKYAFNIFMMVVFYAVFAGIIWLYITPLIRRQRAG